MNQKLRETSTQDQHGMPEVRDLPYTQNPAHLTSQPSHDFPIHQAVIRLRPERGSLVSRDTKSPLLPVISGQLRGPCNSWNCPISTLEENEVQGRTRPPAPQWPLTRLEPQDAGSPEEESVGSQSL